MSLAMRRPARSNTASAFSFSPLPMLASASALVSPEPFVTPRGVSPSPYALRADGSGLTLVSTLNLAPDVPVAMHERERPGTRMVQLPNWTDEVSDLVMDAQVIAARAVDADGVRTADEQALLDALRATQARIQVVEDEINAMTSTLRNGQRPKRFRIDDAPQAA